MNRQRHTVSVHFVTAFLRGASRLGLDHEPLLQQSLLNPQMVASPQLRITSEQLSRVARGIWLAGDDELLGLSNYPLRFGVFGLFAKQTVHCTSLREVYRHLCVFYNLVGKAFQLEFVEAGERARLTMRLTDPQLDDDHAMCEFLTLMWHRFPSWLIGRKIPLLRIQFEFSEPAHSEEYQLMYPCPVEFEQPVNCLEFERSTLDAKILQTPDSLHRYLKRIPFDWFKQQSYYPVYAREVVNILKQHNSYSDLDMDSVAAAMHVTSRTLRRKLADEHTSFQTLKDNLRRDAAIHLLSRPNTPIASIAEQLQFSDPAAFTRAFKSWTGVSPSLYRKV